MTHLAAILLGLTALWCLRSARKLDMERAAYQRATERLLTDSALVRRHIEHVRRTSRLAGRFSEN